MQQSINLLFPATSVVRKVKKGPNLPLVLLNLILILSCVALYGYLHYQGIGLSTRIAKAEEEVKVLSQPLPGEVARRPYIKEKNEMEAAIKTITDTKKLMSKPLDEIAAITDPDITIRSVGIKGNPPYMVITGTAPSKAVVSRFMGNIQGSKYFSNGYIKSTKLDFNDVGIFQDIRNSILTVSFVIEITPNEGVFKK